MSKKMRQDVQPKKQLSKKPAKSLEKESLGKKKMSEDDLMGHRQRLRMRFLEDSGFSMPDYELLELVIFGVVKRGDAKPLAKRLIKSFGSYAGVLSADMRDLKKVEGCGDSVAVAIKVVYASLEKFLASKIIKGSVVYNWDTLLNYTQLAMGWQREEHLRLLLLDDSRCVIFDRKMAKGTVNEVSLYHREVVKHAIEERATGLILIHNHPSGHPTPSSGDIAVTKDLEKALNILNLELFDHLIVSGREVYSFRNNGLLVI